MSEPAPTQIAHVTSEGNQIKIDPIWRFELDGRWILRIAGTVDGIKCEYRGKSITKDGRQYSIVHIRDGASFGVPTEKWIIPECPMSSQWRAFLAFLTKSRAADLQAGPLDDDPSGLPLGWDAVADHPREKDRLVREIMESATVEGSTARLAVNTARTIPSLSLPSVTMQLAMSPRNAPMNVLVDWMLSDEMATIRGLLVPKLDIERRRDLII